MLIIVRMETNGPKDPMVNDLLGNADDTLNAPEASGRIEPNEYAAQPIGVINQDTNNEPSPSPEPSAASEPKDAPIQGAEAPDIELAGQVQASREADPIDPNGHGQMADTPTVIPIKNVDSQGDEAFGLAHEELLPEGDEEDEDEIEVGDEEASTTPRADYSDMPREELVTALRNILDAKPIHRIRNEVESIKVNFYKKHKQEFERKRKEWADAGGDIDSFEAPEDPMEPQIKELLKEYREKKSNHNRSLENQKVNNLEVKQAIIEKIKDLVNRNESVNQTFQEFRELQQKWRETGPVPQSNLDDLWDTYHHHVQNFYDFVKINKELRDLDLRRNLEEKIKLCEKTEELLLESSVVTAFKKLQVFHNRWREIGPVPNEHRTEIWERFKETTSKINKKHQDHFEGLRDEQKANMEAKIALCEKAEEILATVITSNKEWNKRSKEMVELQRIWKTIGFAPKKDNNRIYDRFRTACDAFFSSKREFYEEAHGEHQNNLQLKTELCMQAETLMQSTEWKKTADELVDLQKRWKEIGPVPRKHSEEVWQRFRSACDTFFKRKSLHFSQADSKYADNLKAKLELIDRIEAFVPLSSMEENLETLKEFQRQWAEIGFVPLKKKEEVQKRYREAINKHFENLNIDESKRNILRFKTKIGTIQGNPRQENKLRHERDRLFNQLKQLENDITLWENNIGFFAKSKNAEQLIKDVERKIAKGRQEAKVLEEKIRMIDGMDQE